MPNTENTTPPQTAGAPGSAISDRERLLQIRAEALDETYGGNLDFGHVGLPDVLDWMRIMSPIYTAKVGWSSLMDYDVNSILRIFEEWTQGKHDAELNNELTESPPRPAATIGEDTNRGGDSVL